MIGTIPVGLSPQTLAIGPVTASQHANVAARAVTAVSPSAGPQAGATDLTVAGAFLDEAAAVRPAPVHHLQPRARPVPQLPTRNGEI